MQPNLPLVYVAAGVLQKKDDTILLVQRPLHKEMGGLWEIPGGKIELCETPEKALVRELKEELDIQVDPKVLIPLTFVSHPYKTFHLVMLVFLCTKWKGTFKLREKQKGFEWVKVSQLPNYLMPDADKPLTQVLQERASKRLKSPC